MRWLTSLAALAATAGTLTGCNLDVENPNAPDAERAFQDPAGLQQLLGGAFRTWVETRANYFGPLTMTAMADSYTASWNNTALRFYSSVGVECPGRCGWTNSATAPEAAGGPSIEGQWYGYYTVLSGVNDVLSAIEGGLCFDGDCAADNTETSRNKAMAKMLQGMALGGIALVYDQGFAVTEETDLANPAALPFNSRQEMRDEALASLEAAYTEAGLKNWTTPAEWMGVGGGTSYTSEQMRRVIRTVQAELLALYARNGAENTATNWGQVATYASQGISSGAALDWQFFIDANSVGVDFVKLWGNSIQTMRVDTRLAHILVPSHLHPWPEPDGNPCPYALSADRRVGDGTYGPVDNYNGTGTFAATADAGTDYACAGVAIFPPARGQYHQSNLQHVRYQHLAYQGEGLPGFVGAGQDPMYTRQMNDLMWAEGLIRSNGSAATAAQLINNSRVGRGGLPALTGGETTAQLLAALDYEQEIEFMGQGPTTFFNRRRIDGLQAMTPRHMPVPAKEMDVLVREIYTFGGPGFPDMSAGSEAGGRRVRSVSDIFSEYRAMARQFSRYKR